uniref:Eukaryotic translation initiation factor 4C n=1 Tax=Paramormyrops kingsleyae TaxID=1676925 RepID=A0A3B3SPU5_9TELE
MPKNKGKGGKNRRRGKNENESEKRELVFKEDGQEYAQVIKMLGNGRLEAMCFDGVKRLCHIRGKLRKKVWINTSDIILVGLRDYQDNKADVILKYNADEARSLKAYGELPEHAKINETDTFGPGDDDEIQFDDIGDDDDDIDDVSVQDADGDLCVWVGWREGCSVLLCVADSHRMCPDSWVMCLPIRSRLAPPPHNAVTPPNPWPSSSVRTKMASSSSSLKKNKAGAQTEVYSVALLRAEGAFGRC